MDVQINILSDFRDWILINEIIAHIRKLIKKFDKQLISFCRNTFQ